MRIGLLASSALALAISGCATKSARLPDGRFDTTVRVNQLARNEYSVVGSAKSQSCATYVGLWPIPIFWTTGEPVAAEVGDDGGGAVDSVDLFGLMVESRATGAALYKAVESVEGADLLIAPRFHVESDSVGPWYTQTCVQVRGKAVSIKTDAELTPSAQPGDVTEKAAGQPASQREDEGAE